MRIHISSSLTKIFKWFFLLGALEGMITLVVTLLIPPDPKNAWLLGYSKNRLMLVGGILVAMTLFWGLSLKAWRDDAWLLKLSTRFKSIVNEFRLFLPTVWGLFILIYFSPYVYFWRKADLHPVIERITPIVVWGFLLSVQTLILILMFRRGATPPIPWNRQEEFIIKIKPHKVATIFGIISFLLVFIGVSFNLIDNMTTDFYLIHFTEKMYLDVELNVLTYFSALMLFVGAVLFGSIGILKKKEAAPYATHWIVLALIFVFLSIDEVVSIHEMLNRPVRFWIRPQGIFSFEWVVIGIPFVLLLTLLYLRFFLHLPKRYKWLFAISAGFYIAGALGYEMIGAGHSDSYGWDDLYDLIATVEEALEMTGLVIMIYALTAYLAEHYDQLQLVLQNISKSKYYYLHQSFYAKYI